MNCKPGDLAILIAANIPENIGKIVHVIRRGTVEDWVIHFDRPAWGLAVDNGIPAISVVHETADWTLRPLRPDPVSEPSQEPAEMGA